MAPRVLLGSHGAGWPQVLGDLHQGGFLPPVNSFWQRLFWGDMFPWVHGTGRGLQCVPQHPTGMWHVPTPGAAQCQNLLPLSSRVLAFFKQSGLESEPGAGEAGSRVQFLCFNA